MLETTEEQAQQKLDALKYSESTIGLDIHVAKTKQMWLRASQALPTIEHRWSKHFRSRILQIPEVTHKLNQKGRQQLHRTHVDRFSQTQAHPGIKNWQINFHN